MATHSSILAWRIPWTEEPDGLQSMGLQRVKYNWATSFHFHLNKSWTYANFTFIWVMILAFKNYLLIFWCFLAIFLRRNSTKSAIGIKVGLSQSCPLSPIWLPEWDLNYFYFKTVLDIFLKNNWISYIKLFGSVGKIDYDSLLASKQ